MIELWGGISLPLSTPLQHPKYESAGQNQRTAGDEQRNRNHIGDGFITDEAAKREISRKRKHHAKRANAEREWTFPALPVTP